MGNKVKSIGLIGIGMVAGVAASLQFSAMAQKVAGSPLPLDELRQLADVFGLIKSDYVENGRRQEAAVRRHRRHGRLARPALDLPGQEGLPRNARGP
jgi:hypothetical protein